MFHFLAQQRLRNRGFSSGKKRRKTKDSKMSEMIRSGWQVASGLFVVFALLVSAWIVFASPEGSLFSGNGFQTTIVVFVITATLSVHWHVSQPETFRRNSRVTLMLSVILIQLMLIRFSGYIGGKFGLAEPFELLILPYVFAPMVVSLLIERQHGTLAVVYASLFGGMMVPSNSAFLFVIYSVICGFVAIYLTDRVRKRSRLVTAGIFAGVACAVLAFTLGQIQIPLGGPDFETTWKLVGRQALTAILVSTLTAIVVSGVLPLIEGLFRITTDVSWIELADLNHPLLKEMTIEAPGTYHHSLVVATLAETAAEEVGANAVMCRVCAYFHDIGKMKKPGYFVENIGDGPNPHDDLTPTMSALIVMAHVKDGVDLAIQHKLKREIIDVIKEHHGTSLIRFFHHRALEQQQEIRDLVRENQAHEEDVPEVKAETFRYAGPRPLTRESAIISLADAVESASRSLKKPTPKKIEEMIEEIFRDRLLDGQLDRAKLTLADLAKIKQSFGATIRSMMHNRIEYPALEKEKEEKNRSEGKPPGGGDSPKATSDEAIEKAPADAPQKKKGKASDQSQKVLARLKKTGDEETKSPDREVVS